MFNRNEDGYIVGFCNDFLCMSWQTHCVNIWDSPPVHYFNPKNGDFIIRVNREYKDIKIYPLTKENHCYKGNYWFSQKHKNHENGKEWIIIKDED